MVAAASVPTVFFGSLVFDPTGEFETSEVVVHRLQLAPQQIDHIAASEESEPTVNPAASLFGRTDNHAAGFPMLATYIQDILNCFDDYR